ncbi:MAG TPA: flagellar basal body L-ring protein FlgH, partial [Campylobacterales bacterium]|nr:flagellar basal body L-ring protein FlgH [Campylobacterales bacterium]
MNKIYIGVAVCSALLLSGCSRHPMDPDIDMKPPKYVEQMEPKEDSSGNIVNAGSLFGQGENPLYSDRKAMRVNDIVRVAIKESATSSSSSSKKLSRNQQDTLGGGVIASPSGNLNPQMGGIAGRLNGFLDVGLTTSSSYTFDGSGKGSRQESFATTVSARVIKVMTNGTYFIDGSREVMIDGEKQIMRVSGVIRADDIGKDNSIN